MSLHLSKNTTLDALFYCHVISFILPTILVYRRRKKHQIEIIKVKQGHLIFTLDFQFFSSCPICDLRPGILGVKRVKFPLQRLVSAINRHSILLELHSYLSQHEQMMKLSRVIEQYVLGLIHHAES